MKRLYASHTPVLLDQLAAELARVGIRSFKRNENMTGQAAGELPPVVCWPELWLYRVEDEPAAKRVLKRVLDAMDEPGDDWHCPGCGELIEGQFGECWRCAGEPGET